MFISQINLYVFLLFSSNYIFIFPYLLTEIDYKFFLNQMTIHLKLFLKMNYLLKLFLLNFIQILIRNKFDIFEILMKNLNKHLLIL